MVFILVDILISTVVSEINDNFAQHLENQCFFRPLSNFGTAVLILDSHFRFLIDCL